MFKTNTTVTSVEEARFFNHQEYRLGNLLESKTIGSGDSYWYKTQTDYIPIDRKQIYFAAIPKQYKLHNISVLAMISFYSTPTNKPSFAHCVFPQT